MLQSKLINKVKGKKESFELIRNQDHSKWMILNQQEVLCFLDLNDSTPQEERGGLAICIKDKQFFNNLKAIMSVQK